MMLDKALAETTALVLALTVVASAAPLDLAKSKQMYWMLKE